MKTTYPAYLIGRIAFLGLLLGLLVIIVPDMGTASEPRPTCQTAAQDLLSETSEFCSIGTTLGLLTSTWQAGESENFAPHILYHAGKREHLIENAEAGTIPQKVWDSFIMPEKSSRYGLHYARRGLYGLIYPENDWGDWIMEIHIKPECTTPERVGSIERLSEDPRFKAWIRRSKNIFASGTRDYSTYCKSISYQGTDECSEIAEKFFTDHHVGVAVDGVIPRAWYIRDRECIENVLSTPEQWLQILKERRNLWADFCKGSGSDGTLYTFFKFLDRLFAELKTISEADKKAILKNASAGGASQATLDELSKKLDRTKDKLSQ